MLTLLEQLITIFLESQRDARVEFVTKTYKEKWKPVEGAKTFDDIMKKALEVDPTPKGLYLQWIIAKIIKDPTKNRVEDLARMGEDVRAFEELKRKNIMKGKDADVNSYASFEALFSAIEPHLEKKKISDKEEAKKAAKLAKVKEGIETVVEGPDGWIKIPKTQAAATILGQGTRWCTSGKNGNMFDHYNKTDTLFVVYDKKSKKIYQLHIQSGQFADDADRNAGRDKIPDWAKEPIADWYIENNPKLTFKQLTFLHDFKPGHNLAKGTDHEGLLDLMKEYGI